MKYLKLTVLATFIILLTSCEKNLFEENLESTNPQVNFEYLWNQCNEKYSYFDLKNVNWDNVKSTYSAKLYDGMSNEELFDVLGGMLKELKDGHTALFSNLNISFFPIPPLGQDNYDPRIVLEDYLSYDLYTSGPFQHDFLNNTNNEIGYIRLDGFTGTVDDINLDFIINKYKNTKGIILDLRENGGGAASDIFKILSRFVENKTLIYYNRIKTGVGHNDFSDAMPAYVRPHEGIRYKNKVAVLIDRGSFSAASFFALATKGLPNMMLIGDTTGGGLGAPNGGQLPNGWIYKFSTSQALTLDKKTDFENGVPPDIQVLFDWNDLTKDEVIERALIELE